MNPTRDEAGYTRSERVHTTVAACLGWLFSAMDVVLLLLLRERIGADLQVSPATMDTAIGAGLVFSAIGAVLFAQLGDRIGRARALGYAILLYSVATGAMALAWDAWSLIAFRAISGIGTGGEWSLGFALISEVARAKRRGTMGGLVQSMYNVGTLVGVILSTSLGGQWRLAFGLAVVPALALVYVRFKVPESKLFVQYRAARKAGQVPPELEASMARPPLSALFHGPLLRVTVLASVLFTVMNLGFFMFGSQITRFVQAPVAEGGLGWTQLQSAPVFALTTVVAGLSAVLAGFLSDRLGRRLVYSGVCAVGALAFSGFYWVLPTLDPAKPALFWAVLAVSGLAFGINGIVGAFLSELYPTHLRATGPGLVSNLGKLLAGGGPPLAGWVIATAGAGAPRMGFAVALALPALGYALLAALVWTLPRVTGRTLAPVEGDEVLGISKPDARIPGAH